MQSEESGHLTYRPFFGSPPVPSLGRLASGPTAWCGRSVRHAGARPSSGIGHWRSLLPSANGSDGIVGGFQVPASVTDGPRHAIGLLAAEAAAIVLGMGPPHEARR